MANWSKEQVEQTLQEKGWPYEIREIQDAIQFVLADGVRVNLYNTGRIHIQGRIHIHGRDNELLRMAEDAFSEQQPSLAGRNEPGPSIQNRVFIVYGHDKGALEQLELFLRRLKLEPIILQNLPSGGDTLIEKLETFTDADFACVLLTPDDEGHPVGKPEMAKPRARQNVVLELGMVLTKLGRSRVAILVKGEGLERPSDIEGLIYIPFKERIDETKNLLGASLQDAGFNIQVRDLI